MAFGIGRLTRGLRRVARALRDGRSPAQKKALRVPSNAPQLAARHWDKAALAGLASQWTRNPLIERAIYDRITGGVDSYWIDWLLDHVLRRNFERVLSLGCGAGDHEMIMARNPHIGRIDAFDLSPASVRLAEEKRRAAGYSHLRFFEAGFDDFDRKLGDARYDLVCFFGALHHVRNLEDVLAAVHRRLTDDGRLVFNEYTGDCYTILDARKVDTINRFLAALDPAFLNPKQPRYGNPTLDEMYAYDPSEGVRSALIIPFLRHRFEIDFLRPFGGAMLHMLYPCLNHERLNDGSPESESIVRLLIEADRILYEDARYLPSDFHVGICRKK